MSLINQVLKDVEKRRRKTQLTKQNEVAGIFSNNSNRSYKWQIISAVFVFFLIIIAAWWIWSQHNAKANVKTHQMPPKQMTAAAHLPKAASIPKMQHAVEKIKLPPPKIESVPKVQHAMTKVKLPQTQEQLTILHYQQAMQAVGQGRYGDAINMLTNLVKAAPYYLLAREQLVTLLIKQNRTAQAQQWLMRGLKQRPDYVPFVELDARILLVNGQTEKALDVLQTISPQITQYPEYYVILADVQQQLGNAVVAASIYEKLLHYDPSNSYWWMGLGISLEKSGQKNLALTAYSKALSTGSLNFSLNNYVQLRVNKLKGLSN